MSSVSVEQFKDWRETYQGLSEAQFIRLAQDFLKPTLGNSVYSAAFAMSLERLYASPTAKLSTEPLLHNALSPKSDVAFSLKMYRGEHGEGMDLNTRLGALAFTKNRGIAEWYACHPNNKTEQPKNPRVITAEVKMFNPLVLGSDELGAVSHENADPFVECSTLLEVLPRSLAVAIILDSADHIYNTDNWGELAEANNAKSLADYLGISADFSKLIARDQNGQAYDVASELLVVSDEKLSTLYFNAYPVVDNSYFISQLVRRGYDGVVHGGSGESAQTPEYRPFSKEQINVLNVCFDSPELLKVRQSYGLPIPQQEQDIPKPILEAPPSLRPR